MLVCTSKNSNLKRCRLKRFAMIYLKKWFDNKKSKPLIIRGARQVGKSTLVRLFCEDNNIDLIEINLEKQKLKSSSWRR
jgi:predicted AAA+ superfamily ATPase